LYFPPLVHVYIQALGPQMSKVLFLTWYTESEIRASSLPTIFLCTSVSANRSRLFLTKLLRLPDALLRMLISIFFWIASPTTIFSASRLRRVVMHRTATSSLASPLSLWAVAPWTKRLPPRSSRLCAVAVFFSGSCQIERHHRLIGSLPRAESPFANRTVWLNLDRVGSARSLAWLGSFTGSARSLLGAVSLTLARSTSSVIC
jgi:hypothetical protein